MNAFIREFVEQLRALTCDSDLRVLLRWLFARQSEIASTAAEINAALRLSGAFVLQPDLPSLTVGSRTGLLVLAANPGWKSDLNVLEDAYCRSSADAYEDLVFNFFEAHPRVVGQRVRWWNAPMSFLSILRSFDPSGKRLSGAARWRAAHATRSLGGWELFPWHSASDGLSKFVTKEEWLHEFFCESARAALRVRPELLLVASKSGYELIRHDVLPEASWTDFVLGSKIPIRCSYARLDSGVEVLAIARQIFSARRDFKNEEVFEHTRRLRSLAA